MPLTLWDVRLKKEGEKKREGKKRRNAPRGAYHKDEGLLNVNYTTVRCTHIRKNLALVEFIVKIPHSILEMKE